MEIRVSENYKSTIVSVLISQLYVFLVFFNLYKSTKSNTYI